ncbi:MAG: AarF/ABC1/UbiB kinase family protein [Rhodothermales bacterium]|nr:AarF/ABC1/UbiB kinase family protein [Rhodothermales bacterium]
MEADKKEGAEEFPATRFQRGKIAAKTGLKVGSNYARYLARRSVGKNRAEERRSLHGRNASDILSQLTKLRGTALKLAQGMSIDPGILPAEFTEILSKAQYQVPPMNSALVQRIVKQELGALPEKLFKSFDLQAVAAASLGQVHRAEMHDGSTVAVKVQYPNVRQSIDSDLRMVRGIAEKMIDGFAIDPYLEEVRDRLSEETNYLMEGENIEFFADQYTSDRILTPRWVPEFSSTKVLTMTYIEGVHLAELVATEPSQERRNEYGQTLWDFAHEQVAAQKLAVHADAHPGNFLFLEDGRVGVLDFGCIKRFPVSFRDDLLKLFRARLNNDQEESMTQYVALQLLSSSQSEEMQSYLLEILETVGDAIAEPYRSDQFDFGNNTLLSVFEELMPKLTGRNAFKHRSPVGSSEFVFLNRLVFGLLSILTKLGCTIDTSAGRKQLLSVIE